MDGEHLLGDVAERQVADRDSLGPSLSVFTSEPRRPHDVRVRDHHGLRLARRARRVDQRADVVGLLRLRCALRARLSGTSSPILRNSSHAEDAQASALRLRRGCPSICTTTSRLRQALLLGDELLDLRGGVGERDLRLAVIGDVPHLLGRVRRVDARGNTRPRGSRRRRPSSHSGLLYPMRLTPLPGLDAELDERARDATRVARVGAPRRRPPAAVSFHAQRGPVSVRFAVSSRTS